MSGSKKNFTGFELLLVFVAILLGGYLFYWVVKVGGFLLLVLLILAKFVYLFSPKLKKKLRPYSSVNSTLYKSWKKKFLKGLVKKLKKDEAAGEKINEAEVIRDRDGQIEAVDEASVEDLEHEVVNFGLKGYATVLVLYLFHVVIVSLYAFNSKCQVNQVITDLGFAAVALILFKIVGLILNMCTIRLNMNDVIQKPTFGARLRYFGYMLVVDGYILVLLPVLLKIIK